MASVIPVILSGGSGSRLWPKSRHHYPKQLHCLYGEKTMLQETVCRVNHLDSDPIVICNQDQRFMVAEQIKELGGRSEIILEPLARNTAPAIVIAALRAFQIDPDSIIAVFPADHLVKDVNAFRSSLDLAVASAQNDRLVTFGIVPTHPETGYGYIQTGSQSAEGVCEVKAFVEKPSEEVAREYVASGEYLWNSGMFVFRSQSILDEVRKFSPGMIESCTLALTEGQSDLDFYRLNEEHFSKCENESIDYAVMEKTDCAYVVPLSVGWSDVGSWQALWDVGEKDANENVFQGDVIAENSSGCYINSEGRLVALVGVKDLVVVETADSVLIANKESSQEVKQIVARLKSDERSEYLSHREEHRPWGSYDLVDSGDRFQVKRITVKPGASLSMQMHYHRAEHWIVVSGTALVQKGDQMMTVAENQSVYIPVGEKHQLSNPGKIPLYLVEVASGSYLAEDDVVRMPAVAG